MKVTREWVRNEIRDYRGFCYLWTLGGAMLLAIKLLELRRGGPCW